MFVVFGELPSHQSRVLHLELFRLAPNPLTLLSYEHWFNHKHEIDENHYTNALILLVEIVLCSKFRSPNISNLDPLAVLHNYRTEHMY